MTDPELLVALARTLEAIQLLTIRIHRLDVLSPDAEGESLDIQACISESFEMLQALKAKAQR